MKKRIRKIAILFLGILVIFGINRWVTRPITAKDQTVIVTENEQNIAEDQTLSKEHTSDKLTTSETEETELPEGSLDDWNLILVGPDYPLAEDFPESSLQEIPGSVMKLDKRVIEPFEQLRTAAAKAGFPLAIVSAYRSISYQEQVFNDEVILNMNQGMSEAEATEKAKETMTEPGHSEHHTGLAIDIVDEDWQNNYTKTMLDAEYGDEPGAKWLAEHAREYGFIVRYPENKENITKITYEPWHFRYVGVEHATYIEEHGLTLEEYLDLFKEK